MHISLLLLSAVAVIILLPLPLVLFGFLYNLKEAKKRSTERNVKGLVQTSLSAGTSLLTAVLTRPFPFLGKLPLPAPDQDETPILMVHGLYHNNSAWLLMRYRLNRAGYSNLNTWQYNSFTTSYPELVIELRDVITKLHRKTGKKVLLIGHSLGGLLSSGAASAPEVERITSGIITLGTPYRGSVLALFASGHLGRSLHPEHSLFKGQNKIRYPENISKTAVISPTDEMVQPWKNLIPETGDWKIKYCKAMGHVAMLYSKETARTVVEEINGIIHSDKKQ